MLEIEMISLLSINFSNKCIGHFIITILYYMTCIEEKHKTRQKIVYIFVGYIEKLFDARFEKNNIKEY